MISAFGVVHKSFSLKYGWRPITALGSSGVKPMPEKGLKTIAGSHTKAFGRQSKKDMAAAREVQETSDQSRNAIEGLKTNGTFKEDGIKLTSTGTVRRKNRPVYTSSSSGSKTRGPGPSATAMTLPKPGETNRTTPTLTMVGDLHPKFKIPKPKEMADTAGMPKSYKEVKGIVSGKIKPSNPRIKRRVATLTPKKRAKLLKEIKSHKKQIKSDIKSMKGQNKDSNNKRKKAQWQIDHYNKAEIGAHEIKGHATRRKGGSALYRLTRHPEKLWGDEARSDSMMSRIQRTSGAYHRAAFKGEEFNFPRHYRKGLEQGGAKKYRATTRAIERARARNG